MKGPGKPVTGESLGVRGVARVNCGCMMRRRVSDIRAVDGVMPCGEVEQHRPQVVKRTNCVLFRHSRFPCPVVIMCDVLFPHAFP